MIDRVDTFLKLRLGHDDTCTDGTEMPRVPGRVFYRSSSCSSRTCLEVLVFLWVIMRSIVAYPFTYPNLLL